MKAFLVSGWLEALFRLILGITFVYASIHKIAYPDQLAHIIYGYRILPPEVINLQAIFMPWVELLAGMALILGLKIRGASVLISAMLLVFILAIGFNLFRGLQFDCGCFSFRGGKSTPPGELLVRDVVLFALGLWLFFSPRSSRRWTLLKSNHSG
jgi:uncharacterized membrane protein YphA (DoxX/SURF4 family)